MSRFKHMTKNDLKKLRKETIKSSEMIVDDIDNELDDRDSKKVFKSMAQYWDENDFRHFDKTKCDFFDCKEEAKYRSMVDVDGEVFGVWACREHTRVLYNPRHRVLGNSDLERLEKEKRKKND